MKTLKGSALSTFSYSQTQKLCAENPTAFDCDWSLWRDKAMADFGISAEFFDLVPQLPGSQRYLQIKSYHVLTPDMAVRVYPDGFIEGVYESYRGVVKAVCSDNEAMKNFFTSRLKPVQISFLAREHLLTSRIKPLSPEDVEALNSNKNYKSDYNRKYIEEEFYEGLETGEQSEDFLNLVLESGRTDWIDQIIHRYFTLPPGFSIQKDIPYIPFWAEEFPVYDLPPYKENWFDAQQMLSHAIEGSNVKVVDFLRSIFRENLKRISRGLNNVNGQGFATQKKPEEAFGIYKRFKEINNVTPFMLEQALDMESNFLPLLEKEPGNLPILLVSLPFLDRSDLEKFGQTLAPKYPLSQKIISQYLEE